MYTAFQLSLKYLRYYLTASNGKGHGMHSPFVFEFITNVLNDRKEYPGYRAVENLRSRLEVDKTQLLIEDFGAGSSISKTNQRSIGSIAKHAAKPARFGQLLFRMVQYYRPGVILELGTSLGITTCYLSLGNPEAVIETLEGANTIAAKARVNFHSLKLHNISIVEGDFNDTLVEVISKHFRLDFVFVDGNHRREPTEKYFQQLLPFLHNDSILVFDDIHWSGEMEQAWKTIQCHPSVRCTIDLFFIGIVLFRQEFRSPQHFTVRF